MVSSRDRRIRQRRDSLVRTVARTPPPAFLFPIQRCQRPDRLPPTPLFSAGGRRRRLSSGRPLECQSVVSDFLAAPRELPELGAKTAPGPPRGIPQKVRSDSIEARENIHPGPKIKGLFRPRPKSRLGPPPSGRRLSSGRPPGCQPLPVERTPQAADRSGASGLRPTDRTWTSQTSVTEHGPAQIRLSDAITRT